MQTLVVETKFRALVETANHASIAKYKLELPQDRQILMNMTDHLQRLRAPGTALIIAASLNGMIGVIALLGGLLRLSGLSGREELPIDEVERMGYVTSTVLTYGISVLSLLLAPVIIYGAVRMMQGKNYRMARVAAMVAINPFTACCFVVSVPIGIWAMVLLGKPEVKAVFATDPAERNIYPPEPPPSW